MLECDKCMEVNCDVWVQLKLDFSLTLLSRHITYIAMLVTIQVYYKVEK